jgi:cell cycle arrest protein BUB2
LRIPEINVNEYLDLVAKKKSKYGDKIRDDTFRTFGQDDKFKRGVQEVKLVRVLNAYCHSMDEKFPHMTYVQGMTFHLAPFLYVMPEVDAFFCYKRLLLFYMPNYVLTNLQGVHAGASVFNIFFFFELYDF